MRQGSSSTTIDLKRFWKAKGAPRSFSEGGLLDDDGLEAVLEEMAAGAMATVDLARVAAANALQDCGNTATPRSNQNMDVVGD